MTSNEARRPIVAIRIFAYDTAGRILLLRRAHTSYGEGLWCLPGGKLDYGDTPEQTVEKELIEETALIASSVTFLFYQNSPPSQEGNMHCVNLYFSCDCSGAVAINGESSEYRWVTLTEALALEPVFGATTAILRLLDNPNHPGVATH